MRVAPRKPERRLQEQTEQRLPQTSVTGPVTHISSPELFRGPLVEQFAISFFPTSPRERFQVGQTLHLFQVHLPRVCSVTSDTALFQIHWHVNDRRLLAAAHERHLRAVNSLRAVILRRPHAVSEALHGALGLLLFDIYKAVSRQPFSWTQHTEAVIRLLAANKDTFPSPYSSNEVVCPILPQLFLMTEVSH